jgi:hypothetical protein
MPNIRESAPQSGLGLNPTETGIEATAGAARRVGMFFNQTADLYGQMGSEAASTIRDVGGVATQQIEHKEVSAGAANFAKMQDDLTNQWNEVAKTADPNDPSVAAKFREEVVKPKLDQFADGFLTEGGQKFAEQHIESLRNHMFTKTAADMSTLAGIAVKQNYFKTVNTLSSTVRNDPSSLDQTLSTLDSSVGAVVGTSPNIDATTAASVKGELLTKGKQAIVQSFLQGVAEKNPDQATKIIESGKYAEFISGPEAKSIIAYARTNQRLAQSEARNARVMDDYTAKQDFHKAANELELSTAPTSPGDSPTLPNDYWQKVRQIGKMPGANLEPGRLKSMVENGERITARLGKPEPLAPISHATTIDLLGRMRATNESRLDTNDEIYKAYGDGKLNTADFNFLNKEFKEMRTPEGDALSKDRQLFFKQYAGAIHGPGYDPVTGSPKLYAAEMDARRMESDLRKKGLDPHLAYDPTSEYFIGKPARLSKYKGSMQGDLSDKAAAPARNDVMPAVPAVGERSPGLYETPRGKMKWTGTGWVQP